MLAKTVKWGALVALCAAITWFFWNGRSVKLGPGIKAPDEPVQTELHRPPMMRRDDFSIMPLAGFQLQAKVLSRKRYFWGKESQLAPIDLALGWGRMSDERVLESIEIDQFGRWYRWNSKKPPIPIAEIKRSSANMHIIPADDTVEKALKSVREGQIITIDGYLVRVNHPSGWSWTSSLSRTDSGDGACEIVYAKELEILDGQAARP